MTVSENAGTSYQTASTYLFVPSKLGARNMNTGDDTNTPGAYFRLGGYSNVEAAASDKKVFYPKQHIADEGADAVKYAAGKDITVLADPKVKNSQSTSRPNSGIMLACNGRILLRSAERVYIHSSDKIHIDSEDKIGLKAGKNIDIESSAEHLSVKAKKYISIRSNSAVSDAAPNSGNRIATDGVNGIELIAGKMTEGGDGSGSQIFIEADELYTQVNGTSTAIITANNFTHMLADDLQKIMGFSQEYKLGASFSVTGGAALGITASVSMDISLLCSISLGMVDIGFNAVEIKIVENTSEYSLFKNKMAALESAQSLACSAGSAVSTAAHGVGSAACSVGSSVAGVASKAGGVMSGLYGLVSHA